MSVELWIFGVIFLILAILGYWRWGVVNKEQLSPRRCEELSDLVVRDLFGVVPNAEILEGIPNTYWRNLSLSASEWIYLCRWMISSGLVHAPSNWGWLLIILNSPPEGLALTQKSFNLEASSCSRPSITIGDGNGPININGKQIVISGESLNSDDLASLICALRADSSELPENDALIAREAANRFEEVLSGVRRETDPQATSSLNWVRQRVSEAVGGAGGAALWAGTVAIGRALGWV